LLAVPLVLLATTGCRDSTAPSQPADSVEQQLDELESTLDSIESEVNDG
jgi:hypothetical protein